MSPKATKKPAKKGAKKSGKKGGGLEAAIEKYSKSSGFSKDPVLAKHPHLGLLVG